MVSKRSRQAGLDSRMILSQSVTKVADELRFLPEPGQSLNLEPWLLGVVGQEWQERRLSSSLHKKPLGLWGSVLWHFRSDTLSEVQNLQSPSFSAGRLRGPLIALSHFKDGELRRKSVKPVSFLDRTRTRVRAQPTSAFSQPFPWCWCSCWNVRRQMFLLASSQLGELPGFKCQIYFYVADCVSWTTQHRI